MSSDLRDQFKQLGLVTEEQVAAADSGRARRNRTGNAGGKSPAKAKGRSQRPPQSKPGANNTRPTVKPREPRIVEVSADLPVRQRVMELIEKNARNKRAGTESYFFTDAAGAVREIKATKPQQKQLANGELAVVTPQQLRDPYVMIPGVVAEQVKTLMPERIVLWHNGES